MSRYRIVDTRMWLDTKFRKLSRPQPNGQSLWQYLLTNPNTTAFPGLFRASAEQMAAELGWTLAGFLQAWGELGGMARMDREAHLVWLPNAMKYDPPANPNCVKACAKAFDEMPECPLKFEAGRALIAELKRFGEPFLKPFEEPIPESGSRIQDPGIEAFRPVEEILSVCRRLDPPTPPPTPRLVPPEPAHVVDMPLGSLENVLGELETARVALFGGIPRIHFNRKAEDAVTAFARAHEFDHGWQLDTYVRWAQRDEKYAKSLNPPGAPEVFLNDSQWPRFQREKPPPPPPPCDVPDCPDYSRHEVAGIKVCERHFYAAYNPTRRYDEQSAAEVRSLLCIADTPHEAVA